MVYEFCLDDMMGIERENELRWNEKGEAQIIIAICSQVGLFAKEENGEWSGAYVFTDSLMLKLGMTSKLWVVKRFTTLGSTPSIAVINGDQEVGQVLGCIIVLNYQSLRSSQQYEYKDWTKGEILTLRHLTFGCLYKC